jgi:hypothetical protein
LGILGGVDVMAVKGAKNKRMSPEEKAAKEARKAVVCNKPGTSPMMFYYTERCILKEDAHKYRRVNRRAASFQKRATREYTTILDKLKVLDKQESIDKLHEALKSTSVVDFKSLLYEQMIDTGEMKKNTSPILRYKRLFDEADEKGKRIVLKRGLEIELESIVLDEVQFYFRKIASSIYSYSETE